MSHWQLNKTAWRFQSAINAAFLADIDETSAQISPLGPEPCRLTRQDARKLGGMLLEFAGDEEDDEPNMKFVIGFVHDNHLPTAYKDFSLNIRLYKNCGVVLAPLSHPRSSRLIPAGYCGTVMPICFGIEDIDIDGAPLRAEVHDFVVELHGPVVWGRSSYEIKTMNDTRAVLLWAWNEARELVAIVTSKAQEGRS
jgi:hypothetical protein